MATGESEPDRKTETRGQIPPAASRRIVLDFETIACGQRELYITYGGETYRLQLTRNRKLILTK